MQREPYPENQNADDADGGVDARENRIHPLDRSHPRAGQATGGNLTRNDGIFANLTTMIRVKSTIVPATNPKTFVFCVLRAILRLGKWTLLLMRLVEMVLTA